MVRSVRRWKALFGLISATAVVAPAAGTAYLGARSNRAERERARQRLAEDHRKEAHFIATAVDDDARRTIEAVAQLFADADGMPARAAVAQTIAAYPLAEEVFRIDVAGHLA